MRHTTNVLMTAAALSLVSSAFARSAELFLDAGDGGGSSGITVAQKSNDEHVTAKGFQAQHPKSRSNTRNAVRRTLGCGGLMNRASSLQCAFVDTGLPGS